MCLLIHNINLKYDQEGNQIKKIKFKPRIKLNHNIIFKTKLKINKQTKQKERKTGAKKDLNLASSA